MISIDDHTPSDPSSSHDLKVSCIDLKSADVDLDDTINQLPNFSIRDYVFGLRSKDIACNWPFSSTSLQLCLKHGVKNLLPPFQSLDCLRNSSSLTRCSVENCSPDEELVSSFDVKRANDQLKPSKKIVSTNPSGSKGEKVSQFHLLGQSGQTRSKEKPPASSQKPGNASVNIVTKKSRLIVKVNSGVENVAPNSETMASKVCPVCKIFSSSSNTTLNAHIDQCLTGEGTMKWTENPQVIVKHKVKPRKMRSMSDIYKTARRCTVEELDRRNGTSWATNSSFPAQESQFQGDEEEEEEPRLTKANHEAGDNEGDVYIDTNGTKVRILSVPKSGPSDNIRKIQKGVKGSKLIMGKKNNLFKKKHNKKFLKLIPNASKLCSPKTKAANDLTKTGQGGVVMAEGCSKDERRKEIMKVVDLGIISRPPWACSKRSGLSKKIGDKNRKVEPKRHKTKDLVAENSDRTFSGSDLSSSRSRKKMITSLSLVKQPLNRTVEVKKETTRMHEDEDDDGDGYPNACLFQQSSDDSDSDDDDDEDYDCEDTPYADNRSNGRKLSSLSRNLSFPASKFNLKRKFSAVEKSCVKSVDVPSHDSSKEQSTMDERTTINKKQETRSITSKGSNEESSTLLSFRAPSFMGLSSSFNPEFSNQECIELYQDQICSTNRAPNDVENQDNYIQVIEPIPIPGPPGSFLPASPGGEMVSEEQVQETKVHSSENRHHDTIDQDSMSNSPVSTVSNSRSSCGKDDTYIKPYFNGDTGITETGQSHSSFKNDQPCCCSRKEAAFNYQNSFILSKQPTELKNFKSEMFSLSNHPNSSAVDSSASPSKPVLRLMGKNLTVVNTDDDEFRPPQSSQRPVIYGQYQNGFESQHLNIHPSRSHVEFRSAHRGFTAPVDCYTNGGPYPEPSRSHYVHNILDSQTISGRNVYNPASISRSIKEIVILDDSPKNEADDNTTRNRFLKENSGQMNPSDAAYQSYVGSGSTLFHVNSFRTSSDNGNVAGKWNIGSSTSYHIPPS
ncbi:hypothetical protein M8C21_025351 [Ambrosia artemisiifolia]|uniref:UBZ4-type domain-containing protein n=1 Tax=Ambrosia artemisiifolia TaxID=4212 RepID=A0AAD5G7M2_AMBAR|nr:hypothetical protein M8C21_025351 [Ambrosia artemisiifolia]